MIAVTGATGELGSRVAARLGNLGIEQTIIVRAPGRAPRLPKAKIEKASSYADAAAIGRALAGVETLFIIPAEDLMGVIAKSYANDRPLQPYDRVHQHIALVAAACGMGVQKIVYVSFISAEKDATFLLGRDHFHTEEYIRSTGIPFTFLRMNLYMDKAPLHVSDDYVIRGPAGNGRVAWVTRDDIADVAVAVLTKDGHSGSTYDVTGPEALTMSETAEILSSVTGKKISYEAQTPHEARTLRNSSRLDKWVAERKALTGKDIHEYELEVWISHYMQIATGEASIVSDTVPRLTGHEAKSLSDYLNEHPESYKHILDY
jgi:NAD(P)H dehydrogenase (quinone)